MSLCASGFRFSEKNKPQSPPPTPHEKAPIFMRAFSIGGRSVRGGVHRRFRLASGRVASSSHPHRRFTSTRGRGLLRASRHVASQASLHTVPFLADRLPPSEDASVEVASLPTPRLPPTGFLKSHLWSGVIPGFRFRHHGLRMLASRSCSGLPPPMLKRSIGTAGATGTAVTGVAATGTEVFDTGNCSHC